MRLLDNKHVRLLTRLYGTCILYEAAATAQVTFLYALRASVQKFKIFS